MELSLIRRSILARDTATTPRECTSGHPASPPGIRTWSPPSNSDSRRLVHPGLPAAPRSTSGCPTNLGTARSDVSRLHGVQRVGVEGLGEPALASLADTVLGPATGQALSLAREVHRRTAGNAFFATQLLRDLQESGGQRAAGTGPLPPAIRDVVSQRLLRLPPRTCDVLREAAVLGQQFALDVLTAMMPGLSAMDVAAVLTKVVQQQQKEIDALKTQLKQQAALIQEVNDNVEMSKPAPQTVQN